MNTLQEQIIELKKKHNVAILAHYYVEGEVKEIADYIGQEVVAGLRPEAIHDEPVHLETFADSVVDAVVDVTELMGSEILMYLNVGESKLVARVSPRSPSRAGDEIKVRENFRGSAKCKELAEALDSKIAPKWLSVNKAGLSAKVVALPAREDIDFEFNEQLIVELYSK